MRIKELLTNKTKSVWDFYRKTPNNVSVCGGFIYDVYGSTPETIQITATDKNPRRSGWIKVNLYKHCIHPRLWNFLTGKFPGINSSSILWIKIEEPIELDYFGIGDVVNVTPSKMDIFDNFTEMDIFDKFTGRIISRRDDLYIVEDPDGNYLECEARQISHSSDAIMHDDE
jgi:hypothetical protein